MRRRKFYMQRQPVPVGLAIQSFRGPASRVVPILSARRC